MTEARAAFWAAWDGAGCEHLALVARPPGPYAEGTIIALAEGGAPFHAHYAVQCDAGWHVRSVQITINELPARRLELHSDGQGKWRGADDTALPALAGCIDIDISATPFTNTLPIRRLGLAVGASAAIRVAYIDMPALAVAASAQCYTRLAADRYRFEALDGAFVAELPVDGDGLVRDYPGLFRRIGEANEDT